MGVASSGGEQPPTVHDIDLIDLAVNQRAVLLGDNQSRVGKLWRFRASDLYRSGTRIEPLDDDDQAQ